MAKKKKHIKKAKIHARRRRKKTKVHARRRRQIHGKCAMGKKHKKRGKVMRRRRGGSRHSDTQVTIMGRKRRRHRGHRRFGQFLGDPGRGDLMKRIGGNTVNVVSGVAGGVVGAYVANMIPGDKKIRAGIPLLGGIVLASMAQVPALRAAGMGLGIMGGLALLKQFLPAVPVLAGEIPSFPELPEIPQLPDRSQFMGAIENLQGQDAYVTQLDM